MPHRQPRPQQASPQHSDQQQARTAAPKIISKFAAQDRTHHTRPQDVQHRPPANGSQSIDRTVAPLGAPRDGVVLHQDPLFPQAGVSRRRPGLREKFVRNAIAASLVFAPVSLPVLGAGLARFNHAEASESLQAKAGGMVPNALRERQASLGNFPGVVTQDSSGNYLLSFGLVVSDEGVTSGAVQRFLVETVTNTGVPVRGSSVTPHDDVSAGVYDAVINIGPNASNIGPAAQEITRVIGGQIQERSGR